MEARHLRAAAAVLSAASVGIALVAFRSRLLSSKDPRVERRAAIDVGSGSTKMVVADVDVKSYRIIREVHSEERPISFSLESKAHPQELLSERTMAAGLSVLAEFAATAKVLGCNGAVAAVATEVFRKAPNGPEYLEKVWTEVGIDVRLVSQAVEAELGFRTAAAYRSKDTELESIVCWDAGGGSFQIARVDPTAKVQSPLPAAAAATPPPPPPPLNLLPPYLASFGSGVVCAQCLALFPKPLASPTETANTTTTENTTADTTNAAAAVRSISPHPISWVEFEQLVNHIEAQLSDPPPSLLLLPSAASAAAVASKEEEEKVASSRAGATAWPTAAAAADVPAGGAGEGALVLTAIGGENSMFRLVPDLLGLGFGLKAYPWSTSSGRSSNGSSSSGHMDSNGSGEKKGRRQRELFGCADVKAAAALVVDKDDDALEAEFGPSKLGSETHLVACKLALLLATLRRLESSRRSCHLLNTSSPFSTTASPVAPTPAMPALKVRYQPCVGSCAGMLTHPAFTLRTSAHI